MYLGHLFAFVKCEIFAKQVQHGPYIALGVDVSGVRERFHQATHQLWLCEK